MRTQSRQRQSIFAGRRGRACKEVLAAYLFLLPAVLLTFAFGLWPVIHAAYVSLHRWNIKPRGSTCLPYWLASLGIGSPEALRPTDCLGVANYVKLLGLPSVASVAGLLLAALFGFLAYRRWQDVGEGTAQGRAVAWTLAALVALALALPGLIASGEWTYLVSLGLLLVGWLLWHRAGHSASLPELVGRLLAACALVAGAGVFFFVDFRRMWMVGDQDFFKSIIYTFFYSLGTVPVQLSVALVLAYILFQGIKGQGLFRLLYFMPYIAPSVATAVVFKRIFSLRETGLMNLIGSAIGLPALKWLHESRPVNLVIVDLLNQLFGTHLSWPQIPDPLGVILAGPSLALVSIMIYNWWVFIGYDTVIYLAGLGNIPRDLYEAAEVDGANRWAILRKITIPLLSPTTFFLTIIATIGTFKAFNHIFVMKEAAARGTVDVASILIFQTFRAKGQFGEAAAMAFVLFGIILALSQIQNRVGERMVFYG